jgi:hypothetical protein
MFSGETTADYLLYLLCSTLSRGTTLQTTVCSAPTHSLSCETTGLYAALFSVRRYNIITDYLLRSTLSGETTAHYLLYLLRSILSGGTTNTTRLSAILLGKTTGDSLLRSSLSDGTTLQPTIISAPPHSVWREDSRLQPTSATLYSALSGGTILQPTLCCPLCLAKLQLTIYSIGSALLCQAGNITTEYLLRSTVFCLASNITTNYMLRSTVFYLPVLDYNQLFAQHHSAWRDDCRLSAALYSI